MKSTIIGGCVVVFGFACVLAFQLIRTGSSPSFVAQSSVLELNAPTAATTGTLAAQQGEVLQLLRENDQYTPATPGGTLRQGEAVATKQGAVTIVLGDAGIISLSDHSEISFVNLVPSAFLFRQKSGTISYEVNALNPFSFRVLRALVTLNGDAVVALRDTQAIVTITKGTAKLALVDTQNNTNVWDLTEHHRAIINDETRTVSIR